MPDAWLKIFILELLNGTWMGTMLYFIQLVNIPVYSDEFSFRMKETNQEIDGLRALDPQTITDVHNRFYPVIYRYFRYRINDAELSEDLTADVFVRLLEALHTGRGPRSNLRGWLMGMASHMVNDHYRRFYSRVDVEFSEEIEIDHYADPHHEIEIKEDQRYLRSSMSKLTEQQKQVLALRFGSGFTLEETAETMGKNVNAIKALQFRALESLRRGYEEKMA